MRRVGCGMADPLILGVDPGLKVTGWCLIRGRDVADHGSIRLPKAFRGDRVFEMTARLHDMLTLHRRWLAPPDGFPLKPDLAAVERYTHQGKARAVNPAGVEVAELAREQAHECRLSGIDDTVLIPRNDALRSIVSSRRGSKIPSEKEANAALEVLIGVRLPNQHERDAAMQCWAARQRWRAGR